MEGDETINVRTWGCCCCCCRRFDALRCVELVAGPFVIVVVLNVNKIVKKKLSRKKKLPEARAPTTAAAAVAGDAVVTPVAAVC
jgi:hypothetical protein